MASLKKILMAKLPAATLVETMLAWAVIMTCFMAGMSLYHQLYASSPELQFSAEQAIDSVLLRQEEWPREPFQTFDEEFYVIEVQGEWVAEGLFQWKVEATDRNGELMATRQILITDHAQD